MKFIVESMIGTTQSLTEGTGADKKFYIDGIFMQAEKPNRNGRIYSREVMNGALKKYVSEQVSKGRACGELGHPEKPPVNLDRVSHKITSLTWDGNDVMGRASILSTPMGNVAKGLIEGGIQLGVSTRGMGSLENINGVMSVKGDFMLTAIDIVQDPSAPDAFVNGIMEGIEYFIKGNEIICEEIKNTIKKTSSNNLEAMQKFVFEQFLDEV